MLKISKLNVELSDSKKVILKNINITINPGEVHLINGNNGSGKSSLVNTIMGNPLFKIISGTIKLVNENYNNDILDRINNENIEFKELELNINITDLEVNLRSYLGIYLANQYPLEIPGVALTSFLRLIYNSRKIKEEQIPIFKFKKFVEQKAELINYPLHLLKRNLNEGFSGGEKKKTEILQMLILEPKYIMLDEIDSGLDKSSVKEVFSAIVNFKKLFPNSSLIIISHYDKVQEYLTPNFIHDMKDGYLN